MLITFDNALRFPDLPYASFLLNICEGDHSTLFEDRAMVRSLVLDDVRLPDVHGFIASFNFYNIRVALTPKTDLEYIGEIISRGSKITFDVEDSALIRDYLSILQRFMTSDEITILSLRPYTFSDAQERGLLHA